MVIGQTKIYVFLLDEARANHALPEIQLSEDELIRASHCVTAREAARFIEGRASLRYVLGSYLAILPTSIIFSYGPCNKPFLHPSHATSVQFSVSHSHGLFVCAVNPVSQVGIDIEHLHSSVAHTLLKERFYSLGEKQYVDSFEEKHQERAFLTLWVIKEAYVKALGVGMALFETIEVALIGEKFCIQDKATKKSLMEGWQLDLFEPRVGYIGCLVSRCV